MVAVVLGAIALGESLGLRPVLASVVIVAGVVMIMSATGRRPAAVPAAVAPGTQVAGSGGAEDAPAALALAAADAAESAPAA